MARYFAGNTLASFFRTVAGVVEVTTASRFDSGFVPNAIKVIEGVGSFIQTYDFSATGTVWFHYEMWMPAGAGTSNLSFVALNGTANGYRLLHSGAMTTVQFQYWNGSAWTSLGSTFSISGSTLFRVDIKIVLNTSYEIYVNGTSIQSGSGMSGAPTTITKARFFSPPNTDTFYSQVMIADFDTRDSRWAPLDLNGDSAALTDGTGSYTDIDETVLDESTSVKLTTSGDQRGFTHATFTSPTGYMPAAVVVNARGRINGSGPSDGIVGLYDVTGAAANSGSALGYNTGYEPRGEMWEQDPQAAADWTDAAINDIEIFVEAA